MLAVIYHLKNSSLCVYCVWRGRLIFGFIVILVCTVDSRIFRAIERNFPEKNQQLPPHTKNVCINIRWWNNYIVECWVEEEEKQGSKAAEWIIKQNTTPSQDSTKASQGKWGQNLTSKSIGKINFPKTSYITVEWTPLA